MNMYAQSNRAQWENEKPSFLVSFRHSDTVSSGLALDLNFNFSDSIISPYRDGADRAAQDYFSITTVVFPLCSLSKKPNLENFPLRFLSKNLNSNFRLRR